MIAALIIGVIIVMLLLNGLPLLTGGLPSNATAVASASHTITPTNINSGQYYGFANDGRGSLSPTDFASGDEVKNILVNSSGTLLCTVVGNVQISGVSSIDLEFPDIPATYTLTWSSGNNRYENYSASAVRTLFGNNLGSPVSLTISE